MFKVVFQDNIVTLTCPVYTALIILRFDWLKSMRAWSPDCGFQSGTVLSALIGVAPPSLAKSKKDVLAFATLLAGRLIVINWESTVPPCHLRWMRNTLYFLKLEKI